MVNNLNFCGTTPQDNPNVGDVYFDINKQSSYVWVENYKLLGGNSFLKTDFLVNNKVIRTICNCCGASLPIKDRTSRMVRCSYCGTGWDVDL